MGAKAFLTAMAFSTAAVMGGAPAQSATLIPAVFDFTVGNNNNVSNGNSRIFTATSPQLGTFKVRVTAWSLETVGSNTFVRESKLMVYDGGLGVISGDDGDGGSGRHTIDNSVRKDFIVLQFDRKVQLMDATLNTYSVLNGTRDSDATIKFGMTDSAWTGGLGLANKNLSFLNGLFDGSYSSTTTSTGNSTRNINPDDHVGNLWLIGADFTNTDKRIDGFKLASLAVIPEPATWAMMIGGFGMAGIALRRRRSVTRNVLA